MAKYRIKLNGTVYELEVERVDANAPAAPAAANVPAAPAAAPAPADAPAAAPAAASAAPAGNGVVVSPMPGTVLSVLAQPGARVSRGQAVMVLEAMKMENEITSPADGVLAEVYAAAGAAVAGGAPLFRVEG